ncbi:hypothetical protein AAF712_015431 [Marasmius tenuissimus]|uniref:Uncharacterized protein n=1 Tax=Marasmius tenuissimus TaxID=585030 RepID=A0ABR2ZA91_9AGAR
MLHTKILTTAEAVNACYQFTRNPSALLPVNLRSHICASAYHCPEAGFFCYNLAKHCLESRESQIKCIYHHKSDKSTKNYDRDGKRQMTGVPMEPVAAGKRKKGSAGREKPAGAKVAKEKEPLRIGEDGRQYAHCGCAMDDAVWGFYLWKTLTISYGGKTQPYGNWQLPMIPRLRNMVIDLLKGQGVELEDVWHFRRSVGSYVPVTEVRCLQKQIVRLQAKIDALAALPPVTQDPRSVRLSTTLAINRTMGLDEEQLDDDQDEEDDGPQMPEDDAAQTSEEEG